MTDAIALSLSVSTQQRQMTIAIAWCLAWGDQQEPKFGLPVLKAMRQAILDKKAVPEEVRSLVQQVEELQAIHKDYFPKTLADLRTAHPNLWQQETTIGLVYGGATKIKQYVFESASLSDIRGASALLDRVNLVDLPAFFGQDPNEQNSYRRLTAIDQWLDSNKFDVLKNALIPELIIYSTGGNILAFCPAAFVNELANAIEKRYTHETLTANSCAVGKKFRLLEIRFGLLNDSMEKTVWLDELRSHWQNNPILRAYFGLPEPKDHQGKPTNPDLKKALKDRKNFNELVGKLATQFNQRRSGSDVKKPEAEERNRPSRCYPPMFETHPYLVRDDSDRRSATAQIPVNELPDQPKFSEPLARKHIAGQVAKRENSSGRWYFGSRSPFRQQVGNKRKLLWKPDQIISWVRKFKLHLDKNHQESQTYYREYPQNTELGRERIQEARSLREIAAADPEGFVGYIYADGNNMGQYIRDQIKTPAAYEEFSNDIFEATEQSVYYAIAHHLKPHHYTPDSRSNRTNKNTVWIHPFEIVTIGGDDVLLIVPANQALAIAKAVGEKFEAILVTKERYSIEDTSQRSPQAPLNKQDGDSRGGQIHRYKPEAASPSQSCLSISSGVLITAVDTPIYYADKLVSQLLKSAKKKAKDLKKKGYHGGTVDFLTMKAVTMISSNINSFREEGLTIRFPDRDQELKLYAAPYTLHELGGLIKTVEAIKASDFPRSQLYQIRSLLERGKRTSILNYRYFRVRLQGNNPTLLKHQFEDAWCQPLDKSNSGNLAPWMTVQHKDDHESNKTIYETLWRELVELLPFVDKPDTSNDTTSTPMAQEVEQ